MGNQIFCPHEPQTSHDVILHQIDVCGVPEASNDTKITSGYDLQQLEEATSVTSSRVAHTTEGHQMRKIKDIEADLRACKSSLKTRTKNAPASFSSDKEQKDYARLDQIEELNIRRFEIELFEARAARTKPGVPIAFDPETGTTATVDPEFADLFANVPKQQIIFDNYYDALEGKNHDEVSEATVLHSVEEGEGSEGVSGSAADLHPSPSTDTAPVLTPEQWALANYFRTPETINKITALLPISAPELKFFKGNILDGTTKTVDVYGNIVYRDPTGKTVATFVPAFGPRARILSHPGFARGGFIPAPPNKENTLTEHASHAHDLVALGEEPPPFVRKAVDPGTRKQRDPKYDKFVQIAFDNPDTWGRMVGVEQKSTGLKNALEKKYADDTDDDGRRLQVVARRLPENPNVYGFWLRFSTPEPVLLDADGGAPEVDPED
jgi:hypothetical protein